jgi:hypothetical protein
MTRLIYGWAILVWTFLVYRFWVWIFRFAIFEFGKSGSEFSVSENRLQNFGFEESDTGWHKPSMMNWYPPEDMEDLDLETHIQRLMDEQVPDGPVQMLHSGFKPQHYDTTDIRMVVSKNRHGRGRRW